MDDEVSGPSPSPPCLAELRYSGPCHALVKAASKETLSLSSEPILVGRKAGPEADEMITNLELDQQPRMLSARHARLHFDLQDHSVRISDLGSRNGTQINGVRIREGRLRHADVVTFGGASTCEIGERPSKKSIRSLWQYTLHVLGTPPFSKEIPAVPNSTLSKDGPIVSEFEGQSSETTMQCDKVEENVSSSGLMLLEPICERPLCAAKMDDLVSSRLNLRTPSAARVQPCPCPDSASETKRWSPAESSAKEINLGKRLREEVVSSASFEQDLQENATEKKRLGNESQDAAATPLIEGKSSELFKAREHQQETDHESGVLFIRLSGACFIWT